jgi:translation initiation factor eIF-2B subunit delta
MDARRAPRAVIDPKVRKVGFFTPPDPIPFEFSPSANSLSPVMIPPPRHSSENPDLNSRPSVTSPSGDETIAVLSELFPAPMSPVPSPKIGNGNGDGGGIVASSFPRGGFDLTVVKASGGVPVCKLTTVSVVNADSFAIDGEVLVLFLGFAWF